MRVRGHEREVEEGPEALLARALGRQRRRRGVRELLLGPGRHGLAPLEPPPPAESTAEAEEEDEDEEDGVFFRWKAMNLREAADGRSGGGGSGARRKEGGDDGDPSFSCKQKAHIPPPATDAAVAALPGR